MNSEKRSQQDLEQILDSALADFELSAFSSQSPSNMVSTHQNNNNNNVNISNNFNSQNIPNLKSEAPSANSTSTNAEQSKPTVNDSMNDTDKLVDEFEKSLKAILTPEFQNTLDNLIKENETSSSQQQQQQQQQQSSNEANKVTNPNETTNSASPLTDDDIKNYFAKTLQMLSENLKKLEEDVKSHPPPESKGNDPLDELLNEFENNKEFQGMMETVVKQLMSKEVLYEPMKEMLSKYPTWLNQNKNKLSNEDFNRYTKQYECINRIVQIYDTQGNNAFEEVVQLVNEMHELGQPPEEIVRSLGLPQPPFQGTNSSLFEDPTTKSDLKEDQDCSIM